MRAIYEPTGRAREYAALACNLFTGCGCGCRYCYAPACLRLSRAEFRRDCQARPGILEALAAEAPRYAGDPRRVLLCFACDPFPSPVQTRDTTVPAIRILGEAGMKLAVLTKRPRFAWKAARHALARHHVRFGVSLSWAIEWRARAWEPGADSIEDRVAALRQMRDIGLNTWLSVEPIIDPDQAVEVIRHVGPMVNFVRVGKLNHNRLLEAGIPWGTVYSRCVTELERIGAFYYIKRDLCAAAGVAIDDVHQFGSAARAATVRVTGWCQ